ncbi:MAG: ATP-binding protein [Acidiferrobacterales bacterium]
MENSALSRYATGIIPISVLSVLLLSALLMMHAATQNSAMFGHLYSTLLVINVLGGILLLGLIGLNLFRLITQYRNRVMGSRLTLRLLAMLVSVAVVPVAIVFIFSLQAINKGIDSWFDVEIEQAMDDALVLGRTAFDTFKNDLLAKAKIMSIELEGSSNTVALTALDLLREQYKLSELTLYSQEGRVIASSSEAGPDIQSLLPSQPNKTILSQVRQGLNYANLDPVEGGELQLRVVVPVYGHEVGSPLRMLQVLQQLPRQYSKLGESVQSAFAEYEKLVYLRGPLKFGFTLSLSMVALLTMLIAVSAAIYAARRFVSPIRDLAEGTEAVAQGHYDKQLPEQGHDEFAILVRSFNKMTRRIKQAQSDINKSKTEADVQRTYLETVLAHLSSGVLSFDKESRLQTYNRAAEQILGIDLSSWPASDIDELIEKHPDLYEFISALKHAVGEKRKEWQQEIVIIGATGRRTLMLRGAAMPVVRTTKSGYVVVFDDVTTLIRAQRDAAWGEVARRMAHEIKNPLTPIQLSAERMQHKFKKQLNEAGQTMLERSTRTIIDQVESLKTMVNAFSDYAQPAKLQLQSVQINPLIQDIAELYGANQEDPEQVKGIRGLTIKLDLAKNLPEIEADPERLKQVLHNLVLNAAHALTEVKKPELYLSTRKIQTGEADYIELKAHDNGKGFPKDVLAHLFEPYVTSKEKGTGLGLAIVKKIVEEHNGIISADNQEQGGACIYIQLPVKR